MLRSRLRYCLALLFCALVSVSLLFVPSASVANAMTNEWYPPTCEANFKESTTATLLSKSTVITYNDGAARLSTTYKFSASAPTNLSCSLPIFCRQFEVATCDASLSLNGILATPTYGYSFDSPFFSDTESYSDILTLREKLSDVDPSLSVHEFMVSATDEATFSFSLQPEDRIIYELFRHKYTAATRLYEVNVSPNSPCYFIVFGNKPTVDASELCSITYSQKSIDEYVTAANEFMTQMTNGVDCTEIITHWVINFLSSNSKVSEDRLLDDCAKLSYAFWDYSLELPSGESTIVIEQPLSLGLNSHYDPKVYVGKIFSPAQSAPLSFSVATEQFVVDCTLSLNNKAYNGDAVEAVTIAFCAVKDPTLVNSPTVAWEPWRIAVLSVSCVLGVAAIVWLIILFVKTKKPPKENKEK